MSCSLLSGSLVVTFRAKRHLVMGQEAARALLLAQHSSLDRGCCEILSRFARRPECSVLLFLQMCFVRRGIISRIRCASRSTTSFAFLVPQPQLNPLWILPKLLTSKLS